MTNQTRRRLDAQESFTRVRRQQNQALKCARLVERPFDQLVAMRAMAHHSDQR